MSSKTLMYVPGLERGVRPIGDWSMAISLSRCSSPSMRRVQPRLAQAAVQIPPQGFDQDVVDQRTLARAGHAGHADEHAERDLDVDVLEIVVRRAEDAQPAVPRSDDAAGGVSIRNSPARYLPGHALRSPRPRRPASRPPRLRRRARRARDRNRSGDRRPASCLHRARRPPRYCPCRASRRSVSSRRWLSRGCRPIEGSSRMYSTPTSPEPIWLARRMRCDSPPDNVGAVRSSVR